MEPLSLLLCAGVLFAGVSAPAQNTIGWSIPDVPSHAQARTAAVKVSVVPDRSGWTYALGEPVRFNVAVTADGQILAGASVTYKVGPEMLPAEEKTVALPAGGLVIEGGTLNEPGFIRCSATVVVNGRRYRGVATAGIAPESIKPTQREPEDFDAFWAAAKEDLAKAPLEARRTLMPEACTDKIDVYHVSFRTVGAANWRGLASRIYGILCVPKAPGKHPAVLHVPGAGVRPYAGNRELAERGAITLQIGIHGIPVNQPQEIYDQLSTGALSGYPLFNLDNRDTYYYRRVYLSCLRANDYLVSLPEFDGENLLVTGGSQGGQLSIITAALDPRVKALAALYPAYCDVTGYLHGRAGGWPHMMNRTLDGQPSPHASEAKIATTAYYDVVNFARRLKVPGYFAWGYNDEVCPPTSMYAAYNMITAPKELLLALETGHTTIPEETAIINDWIATKLGLE
ncbi:MAG: acetylxylan esterase [Opitutaceae bacterium]|nr:acetylxylan esterase [Cephaloticoccus sp.]MCP5530088.1 acetylxylan esterase [Opitutaceae bacterium]